MAHASAVGSGFAAIQVNVRKPLPLRRVAFAHFVTPALLHFTAARVCSDITAKSGAHWPNGSLRASALLPSTGCAKILRVEPEHCTGPASATIQGPLVFHVTVVRCSGFD